MPRESFKLAFNPTDKILLEKAKVEIHNSINKARSTLSLTQDHPIDAPVAMVAAMPRHFLEHFHTYLKTTLELGAQPTWSFSDILTFFRCEVQMRLYSASATELRDFGVSESDYKQYRRVRLVLTKANQPASKRAVVHGGCQLPACSFDPLMRVAYDECNNHWTKMFFVPGISWCDLDDDKIPNSSPLWKQHGMKQTPTKDKKLKPVHHVMALIGAGCVCYVAPDQLKLKLSEMLKKAIDHVSPHGQESQRSSLAFFIDRGYLELARAQGLDMTNLIQIMESMGIKYLGIIKNTPSFPFLIVDLNENPSTVINNKPVVQAYGT